MRFSAAVLLLFGFLLVSSVVMAISLNPIQLAAGGANAAANAAKFNPTAVPGVVITGRSWSQPIPLPSAIGVATAFSYLDSDIVSAIQEAQTDISGEVAGLRSALGVGKGIDLDAMRKVARAQAQDILDGMRNLEVAKMENKVKEDMLLGRVLGGCEEIDASGGLKNGGGASARIREELGNESASRGDGTQPNETAADSRYTAWWRDIFKAACLDAAAGTACDPTQVFPQASTHFPGNDTHTPENLAKAKLSTQFALNPHPTPKVTNPQSADGRAALTEQAKKSASLAPGIAGDDFVTSMQAPTVEWSTLKELLVKLGVDDWESSGGLSTESGFNPNSVVTVNGQEYVSLLKALDLLSQRGFSATWLTKIDNASNAEGLLKEILRFEALRTYIAVQQMRLAMYQTSIAAHNLGINVDAVSNPHIKGNTFTPGHAPVSAATSKE